MCCRPIVFFFLFLISAVFSQQDEKAKFYYSKVSYYSLNKQKDSLKKYIELLLENTKNDTTSYYYNVALMGKANLDRYIDKNAKALALRAYSILAEKGSSEDIFKSFNTLSQIYYFNGSLDTANLYNDSIIQYKKKANALRDIKKERMHEFMVGAYSNKAGNFHYQGNYEQALQNILIAKKYTDSVERVRYPEVNLGIGMINTALGRNERARESYRYLIDEYRSGNNKRILQLAYSSLAQSFGNEVLNDSALKYYRLSKKMADAINNYDGQATALLNIGKIEGENGNLGDAEKNLKSALSISLSRNLGRITPEILNYLGTIYLEKGNYKLAIETIDKGIRISDKNKRSPILANLYATLSKAYRAIKDYDQAFLFYEKSIHLKDSIKNTDVIKNTEELQLKYETEKKENENLQLKQETARKDLTIAQKNNYILFGSLVFLMAIAGLVLYQLRKFKKKNSDLEASIRLQQKAEKELEVARDNIAKDFHDDMGNKLARITALSDLMLSSKKKRKKEEILKALENIKEDSDILYKGTRDFMFSLKAKSDYLEELFTYLSDFGEDFFKSFAIDFYTTKGIEKNVKLPYYWNRQLIMIFKEAMTNIIKHSQAKSASFAVLYKNKKLEISLADDGQGFLASELTRKSGVEHIKIRAEKIGGNLKIRSSNKGTKIMFNALLPD